VNCQRRCYSAQREREQHVRETFKPMTLANMR